MSTDTSNDPQNLTHIEGVDVDLSTKETPLGHEKSTDSSPEIKPECPTDDPFSIDTNILPSKPSENNVNTDFNPVSKAGLENGNISILSVSADSPPANITDSIIMYEKSSACEEVSIQNTTSPEKLSIHSLETNNDSNSVPNITENNIDNSKNIPQTYLDSNKALATSSVSLNETNCNNVTICKSPYSRSAENISSIETNDQNKEVNKESILSEFSMQKNKISATQVITPTENNTSLDVRYGRIPKELLSQDIGSIVKNVHGIFSSVSGSLKNAYTHRANVQIPYMKTVKTVPNGKVMNDIFEDQQTEEKVPISNGIENDIPNLNEITASDGNVEGDVKSDVLRLQIESLERVLMEQRKENMTLRERVKQQTDELQEKDQTFKELENKMDLMSKHVEQAKREKDAAVMRYASVECSAIEARRAADSAARAERAARAELELLGAKIKAAHAEKQRICQLYDDKCHELQTSEREVGKVREELKEIEGRLKWTQSKLRMEMDAYKDSAERVEKQSQLISELEAARDCAAANKEDAVRAKQLDSELKESQAALILARHEGTELQRRLAAAAALADSAAAARDRAAGELAAALLQVEELRASNLRLEEEAAELAALRAQAALADSLGAQLQRETERASQAEEALSRERARAATCAQREAAALEHAARLTAQHVCSQHRAAQADAQAAALAADSASLRERVDSLEEECRQAQAALAQEADRRNAENRLLARKVAELQEEVSEARQQLDWEKGENGVLKKKHASAVKELNRELQRALKRCSQLEARLPPPTAPSTRTGSVTSLSSGESAPQEDRVNGHSDTLPDIQAVEPDRQALIERIVSLQRAAARRAERCEFLEEHARQLTHELRAKSRLLRHLLPTLPAQALSSSASDSNKPPRRLTKKEIARLGGGAMAALWGGDPGGLPPELALEMNHKLQALLEDTLLKNITLKENIDTLGEEIARLKGNKSSSDAKNK